MQPPIEIRAGRSALARIRAEGLQPGAVATVPAAAGGPKGLVLIGLDRFLFGEWLPRAPRERHFIGASIGAWRMAAAVQRDPPAALNRLARAYAGQRYPRYPDAAHVSQVCKGIVREVVAGLPNRKLPDRTAFRRYGLDHDARFRDWTQAIGEGERLAEAFARWCESPDAGAVLPLG